LLILVFFGGWWVFVLSVSDNVFFLFVSVFWFLAGLVVVVGLVGWLSVVFDGEFDPGSGRTLAACFTHASRTDLFGG
jgi:hypothetical protein